MSWISDTCYAHAHLCVYNYKLRHRPTWCVYMLRVKEVKAPMMETGEADRENSRTSLLFCSDFSGFERLESGDG